MTISLKWLLPLSASLMVFAQAQPLTTGNSAGQSFQVNEIASGLNVPWGMSFVSDQEMIITQRTGEALLLNVETGSQTPLPGLPEVHSRGQGGLLDVAIAPDFSDSRWIYFTYSKPQQGGAATTLARAQLEDSRLANWQDLLITDSVTGRNQHFGSRIAFDDQGYVFFGVGDRGDRDEAQNTANHIGAIIRLHPDGAVPEDNPFVGDASIKAEIWSYGHRNPQGMAYDFEQQRLWSNEHGPRGGDEINLIKPGLNYGWPEVTLGREYWGPIGIGADSLPGMEDPIVDFTPSIAPGSLVVYRGDAFPQWQGDLLSGALVLTHLNRVVLDDQHDLIEEERLLEDLGERIRALTVDHQGWLYLSTDSGRILQMKPN